jgi:hypothetical protein
VAYTSASGYSCGAGYRGPACGACAPGFFADSSGCSRCPTSSLTLGLLLPVLQFLLALAALGLLLLAVLRCRQSSSSSSSSLAHDVEQVLRLLLWLWVAAQSAEREGVLMLARSPLGESQLRSAGCPPTVTASAAQEEEGDEEAKGKAGAEEEVEEEEFQGGSPGPTAELNGRALALAAESLQL